MKNHLLITVLLCTLFVLGSTNNCPSYNGNDLLQSGKNAIMRGPLNGNPQYSYQAPVNFMVPSWGLQIAVTTSTIGDYNPLPTYGYNYYIQASRKGTSNYISYKLIMNNDLSWTSVQLSYLVNSRSDIAIGNFQASIDTWQPATSNVYNVYNKIARALPAKTNYKVAAFISGFSTTDSQFALTINKKSYDNDNKNLTVSFYCSADPAVLTLTITYIIFPQVHPILQLNYDITPRGDVGSYQISGPVNFQPSKAVQYNQWRVNNRYLVCSGNQCPGLCTLREDCAKNNGNLWQDQCIYCAPGIVFQYGQCTRRCGANQIYLNRVCVCAKGFTRQGKDCISIVNKTCGTNQVYSQSLKTCVCANNCYDKGSLNCLQCPSNSKLSQDGKSCICLAQHQVWDSTNNTCKNRCNNDQQWQIIINRCQCIPTHCWYNRNCRQCPANSQPTLDRVTCVCKSVNAYYSPQTNTCIECNTNGYQQIDHDRSKCQCKTGYNRNKDSGKCEQNAPQCKQYQILNKLTNKCDCKQGLVRDGLICRPKCNTNQIWDGKFCICDKDYARYGANCKLCPARSLPNNDKSQCVCTAVNQIFVLNTFQCIVCPANSKPNEKKNNCNCLQGFNTNAKGQCVPNIPVCTQNQVLSEDKRVCLCKDGYVRDNNGKCIYKCKVNQAWVNGKCTCLNGFAYNNGVCTLCPLGSTPAADLSRCVCAANQKWVQATFSCVNCQANASPSADQSNCVCNNGWTDYNNDGICEATCGPNQDWVNKKCVCKAGFAFNNGVCTLCPLGSKPSDDQTKCVCAANQKWVPAQFACVNCQANSSPSADQLSCVCNNGFPDYNNDGVCDVACGANQEWVNNKCVCKTGFAFNNGVCTLCPLGSKPSDDQTKCICAAGNKWVPSQFACLQCQANSTPSADQLSCVCNNGFIDYNNDGVCDVVCGVNQEWVNKKCVCKAGFAFNNGVCTLCPLGSKPSDDQTKCICAAGNKWVPAQFACVQCQANSSPSADQLSCVCNNGWTDYNNDGVCDVNCGANQEWVNKKCVCKAGFAFKDGVCTLCPLGSTPSADQTKCVCAANQKWVPATFSCVNCQANSTPSADQLSCVCNNGFTDFNNDGVCDVNCGANQEWINNKCACKAGFAFNNGVCTLCPLGSTPSADQTKCVCAANQKWVPAQFACVQCQANSTPSADQLSCVCNKGFTDYNNDGVCDVVCGANQEWVNNKCICKAGFAFKDGVCTICPVGSTSSADFSKCVCPAGSKWVPATFSCIQCQVNAAPTADQLSCECKFGFADYNNDGICRPACGTNQDWSVSKCVCKVGFAYDKNGVCTLCPLGSQPNADQTKCVCAGNQKWVPATFSCVQCQANASPAADQLSCVCNNGWIDYNNDGVCDTLCGANQQFVNNKCVCKAGFLFNAGVCTLCPLGSTPSADLTKCVCAANQKWVPNQFACVNCQPNSTPSADQSACVCNKGFTDYNNDGVCDTVCGANQEWANNKCVCKAGFAFNNGVCTLCPLGSKPSDDQTKCICAGDQKWVPINFACVQCQANASPSADQSICQCKPGYTQYNKDGICHQNCNINQEWVDKKCVCVANFAYNNKGVCQICPSNSVASGDRTKCICAGNNKWVPSTFQCLPCAANSSPTANQLSCECNPGYTDYNKDGKCQVSCLANQQWNLNKCICKPNFAYNKQNICQECPAGSTSSNDDTKCVCSGNKKWVASTFTCVDCQANASPSADQSTCVCNAGWTDYNKDGLCFANCGVNQKWNLNVCVCEKGFVRNSNKVCTACPANSQISADNSKCICNGNSKWVSSLFQCVACQANSSPLADQSDCVCNIGFSLNAGSCVPSCADPFVFNPITGKCICKDGYFLNGNLCLPNCQNGQRWNGTACVCPDGQALYGTCKTCPVGTLPNSLNTACICTDSLSIFQSSTFTCFQCPQYSSPSADLSNCTCNKGFTLNSVTKQCTLNCGVNQKANYTLGICQCQFGYYKPTAQSKCVLRCTLDNEQYNGHKCICKPNCGHLNINNNKQCTVCPTNSVSNSDRTSCKCLTPNFIFNQQSFKCQVCPPYSTNAENGTKCICLQGYELQDGVCQPICDVNQELDKVNGVCDCKYGFMRLGPMCVERCGLNNQWTGKQCRCKQGHIKHTGVCKPCPAGTSTNPSRSVCLCADNKKIFDVPSFACINIPVNSCPNFDFTDYTCLPGYNKGNKTCDNSCPSGAIPDAHGQCACTGGLYLDSVKNVCTKPNTCPANSAWNASSLQCQCTLPGQYMHNGVCTSCGSNSFYSTVQQQCVCNTGFFNVGGVCSICDSRTRYNGTDCVCQLGYYGSRDKCNKCHSSCAVCSGPQANQCQACSDVSMILQNGYCTKNNPCDPGFFLDQVDTKTCQKCTDNCIICDSIFECLHCAIGYQAQTFQVSGQNITACTQICGDGIKYEQECDDGNTISGDGCSSTCNIEAGWSCFNGSSGHKSNCNKFIPDTTVLTSMGIVNLGGRVVQSVRASYLPTCLTQSECTNCFKSITVNVLQANVPILCTVNFVPFSQYQFLIQYNFQGLFVTSKFKTVIKLNQAFRGCFNDEDFNQQLEVNVDPAFLAKDDKVDTLTLDQITAEPGTIVVPASSQKILKITKP